MQSHSEELQSGQRTFKMSFQSLALRLLCIHWSWSLHWASSPSTELHLPLVILPLRHSSLDLVIFHYRVGKDSRKELEKQEWKLPWSIQNPLLGHGYSFTVSQDTVAWLPIPKLFEKWFWVAGRKSMKEYMRGETAGPLWFIYIKKVLMFVDSWPFCLCSSLFSTQVKLVLNF